jgi:asparagine synthase (glutamine-hydrolysing)
MGAARKTGYVGITGGLTLAASVHARAEIEAMTAALYHRGPDAGAVFVDESAGVSLGHRRLAVIELSERGAQPMHSADGRFVFVFNGEIYNYRSLRRELKRTRVVDWRGTSDTETLVRCFAAWGVASTLQEGCLECSPFALWDRAERKLTLARPLRRSRSTTGSSGAAQRRFSFSAPN